MADHFMRTPVCVPPAHPSAETCRAPRENQILAEPATPQRCAEDYAAAADVRTAMGKQARAGGK